MKTPTLHLVTVAVAVLLHGCATRQPAKPPPPASASATAPVRVASPLAVERDWLQSWFRGTPVVITQREDGPLNVYVPLQHSFEAGRTELKPALTAVLDKVAESLRRAPATRLVLVAAPGDGADGMALAQQRAGRMRAHVVARGVSTVRVTAGSASDGAAVQLRLDIAPQP